MMKHTHDLSLARCKAESIAERVGTCGVTFSIGIAVCDNMAMDFRTMYSYADKALYQAKEMGRNRNVIIKI